MITGVSLRAYQQRSIDELRCAYGAGARAVVLVLPTAAGKTVLAAAVAAGVIARGGRVLFLADRVELLEQTARKFAAAGISNVRLIRADIDDGDPDAPATIASIPTLRGAKWLERLPEATFVMIDECHGARAAGTTAIMRRYPDAKFLGLTATPYRGDGQGLGHAFDTIVEGATVRELTDLGYLVPLRAWAPPEPLPSGRLAMSPFEAYQRHTPGRRAIVFATSVEAAQAYAADLTAGGVPAACVHGELADDVRRDVRARFETGELRAVTNVDIWTEGTDIPAADACILACRPGHPGRLIQMTGRVLRLSPETGKQDAVLVDLCGAVLEHGLPDLPRTYSLEGRAISRPDRLAIRQCPTCGGVFEAACVRGGVCPTCGGQLAAERRRAARGGRGEVHEITAERMRTVLLANLQAAARERGLPPEVAERAAAALEARRSA